MYRVYFVQNNVENIISGKLKILHHLKCASFQENPRIFYSPTSTLDKVIRAGQNIMLKLYGGSQNESLTLLRHSKWERAMMVSNDVEPASLLPTERATHFHSLWVFFEMQRFIKLDLNCGLNPRYWGWEAHLSFNGL